LPFRLHDAAAESRAVVVSLALSAASLRLLSHFLSGAYKLLTPLDGGSGAYGKNGARGTFELILLTDQEPTADERRSGADVRSGGKGVRGAEKI